MAQQEAARRRPGFPLKRFRTERFGVGFALLTVCCTLLAGCLGGYTAYASDNSCSAGTGTESDIPEELIEISGEGNSGKQPENSASFETDTTKPTLEATLSGSIITVVARDTESGIQKITVNGTDYTNFTDDTLKIQLTQSDFSTEQFVFTATDEAGNVSDRYTMDNPYYNWPNGGNTGTGSNTGTSGNSVTGGVTQGTSGGASASTTTPVSGGTGNSNAGNNPSNGSTEGGTTSPLPQKAEATQPTEATGTVIDRSGTAAEAVEASGEEVKTVTQTAEEGGKAFYTVQTKSGKTFYLIIDNDKNTENVYLLTEVSEQDLMNFSLPDTVTLPDTGAVRAEPEKQPTVTPMPTAVITQKEQKPAMPEKKNPLLSKTLLILLIAAVGGAGYYFKVYRPKQESAYDDEDDDPAEYEPDEEDSEEEFFTETLPEEDE